MKTVLLYKMLDWKICHIIFATYASIRYIIWLAKHEKHASVMEINSSLVGYCNGKFDYFTYKCPDCLDSFSFVGKCCKDD